MWLGLAILLATVLSTEGTSTPDSHRAICQEAWRDGSDVRFLTIGDWGLAVDQQLNIANAMSTKARETGGVDFILALGDNFYDQGVSSIEDPQWKTTYETRYAFPELDVPWFVTLGNHDWYGNATAQVLRYYVEQKKDPGSRPEEVEWLPSPSVLLKGGEKRQWVEPALWYSVAVPLHSAPMTASSDVQDKCQEYAVFVVLDTWLLDPLTSPEEKRLAQYTWLEKVLRAASARSNVAWINVVGHYPVFSSGQHGETRFLRNSLLPLLKHYRVDLYISGHDHDLEFLEQSEILDDTIGMTKGDALSLNKLHFIVSGAASKTRAINDHRNTASLWGATSDGYTFHKMNATHQNIIFLNSKNEVLYEYTHYRNDRRDVQHISRSPGQHRGNSTKNYLWDEWRLVLSFVGATAVLIGGSIAAAFCWARTRARRKTAPSRNGSAHERTHLKDVGRSLSTPTRSHSQASSFGIHEAASELQTASL